MDGTPFGRYRLLGSLGEGGMGQVFRAYDTETDREVALKVLAPQVAQDASFEQRFRREAHVAARLNDPHVVPIHSYGEIDGRLYVDMRLIAGRDLGSVLEESGAMNPVRAVGIIEQVADALDAAHSIDLVHRDIKPSNILLGRRDFVYLIDFGIAQDVNATRITKTGLAIGTFAYMAPERLGTGDAGRSSDIYSLACVLYECLTGQLPFPGGSMESQIAGHLSAPPPRPSTVTAGVPPAFDEVIARGMAKDPGQRYPTVLALAEAARRAVDHAPQETPPNATPTQFAPMQQAAPPLQAAQVPAPPEQAAPTQHAEPVPAPPRQQAAPIAGRVPGPAGPPGPAPRPWPPAPGPAAPWPPTPGPAQRSPLVGGQPQQRQGNFVASGVLVTIFVAASILIAIMRTSDYGLYLRNHEQFALVNLCLDLVLAVAFGLVAWRCRESARPLSIAAWATCVGAVLAALPLVSVVGGHYLFFGLPLALIPFGVTAHRPFGWWWSVPASLAGLFSTATHIMGLYMSFTLTKGILVAAIWLIPLLVLGIAMFRTRVASEPPPN